MLFPRWFVGDTLQTHVIGVCYTINLARFCIYFVFFFYINFLCFCLVMFHFVAYSLQCFKRFCINPPELQTTCVFNLQLLKVCFFGHLFKAFLQLNYLGALLLLHHKASVTHCQLKSNSQSNLKVHVNLIRFFFHFSSNSMIASVSYTIIQ